MLKKKKTGRKGSDVPYAAHRGILTYLPSCLVLDAGLVQVGRCLCANIHQGTGVNSVLVIELFSLIASLLHRDTFGGLLVS